MKKAKVSFTIEFEVEAPGYELINQAVNEIPNQFEMYAPGICNKLGEYRWECMGMDSARIELDWQSSDVVAKPVVEYNPKKPDDVETAP